MKPLKLLFMIMLSSIFGSCIQHKDVVSMQADAFEKAIAQKNVQVLDVRSVDEFSNGHIANALNIDVQQPDFLTKAEAQLQRKKPVYVYCRSGKRSMVAANMLQQQGYKIVNLTGGIIAWEQAGKPVEMP